MIKELKHESEMKSASIFQKEAALKTEILNSQKKFQTIEGMFDESKKQLQSTKDKLADTKALSNN